MKTKHFKKTLYPLGLIFLGLTACTKTPQESSITEKSPTEQVELTLYSWGEYFDEAILERFTKSSGIKIDYKVYDTSDEMREDLKSRPEEFDVVVMDDLALNRLKRTRMVQQLDKSLLPNLRHIDVSYLNEIDHANKTYYSIPYFWGTTVLAYNKTKIQEPEKSWALLFKPDLKDHVFLVEERMECYENILRYLELDPRTENEQHLRSAASKLLELASSQNATFGSDAEGKTGLLDGSIWAAMVYNGDLAQALQQDNENKIGYFYPREGTTTWVDNFTIPRDTENWEAAHKFINFMMDPLVAAESSIYVRFATANNTAKKHLKDLDPELLNSAVFSDGENVGTTLTEGTPARQKLIHEGWQNVQRHIMDRKKKIASAPLIEE